MLRLFLALFGLSAAAFPALWSAETSERAPLAAQSLLLDIVRVENSLIAVGDRGHVLISNDSGKTWQQSIVPTRAMLTGVWFHDARHGWAVGHDGVIIATTDGGKTWSRQDEGTDLETIFLDVLFLDAKRGFIVGAYGKFFRTEDGGATWTPAQVIEEDLHLNRLSRDGSGTLYIAGEAGTILISRDHGKKWARADVPYEGSLYGVLPLDSSRLIAYGLRGTILFSADGGATWDSEASETKVLIMAGVYLPGRGAVLAGAGGNFFVGQEGEFKFSVWKPGNVGTSVADLVVAPDGALVTVGEAGALRVDLP